MPASKPELITELKEIATELGRAPTPDELTDHSDHSLTAYRDQFGSWAKALDVADLEKPQGRRIPDEVLLAELRRLAATLEKVPSERDMYEQGLHGTDTYKKRFGSWNQAVDAAGLEPNPDRRKRPREALLTELRDVADELGRPPTRSEMEDHTEFAVNTYRNRFASWNEALEAAGLEPRPAQERISDEDLLQELQRLEAELGKPPSTKDMQKKGEFSQTPYYRRFDTWRDALEAAGCDQS